MSRIPRVPSYRLHRPSGQAVVTIAGHDHYLGVHDSPASRQKYDRLIAAWLAGGRHTAAPDTATSPRTVSEVAAAYLAWAESYYRKGGEPTTQVDRVARTAGVLRRLYGDTAAASFGPAALKAVRGELVRHGYTRGVVNQRVGILKRMFKWAAAEELVSASVWHSLQTVDGLRAGRTQAPEGEPVLPVAEDHLEPVLAALPAVLADAARFQLLTACRPGEVLSITADQLDRSSDVWLYRPASHKMQHAGRGKVILVGPQAQAVLAPYLLRFPSGPLLRPTDSTRVSPRAGQRYGVCAYARAVARACARAGVAHWHPSQLRHNSATRIVDQFGGRLPGSSWVTPA